MALTKKVVVAVAASIAAVLVVAGCSSDDNADSSQASSAPSSDAAKAAGLVLTQAELPAGYQVLPVPKDQIQKVSDSMLSATRSAKVTPKCMQLSAVPAKINTDEMGFVVAMKGVSALAQTVIVSDRTIADFRAAVTGKCAKQKVEITEGQAIGAKGTVTSKVIDSSNLKVKDAIVVKQESVMKLNGTTVNSSALLGFAVVDGYLVSLQSNAMGDGASPDLKAFNATFPKAIAKVKEHNS
ncbi:hypothetical protein [Gordonia sp. (in: high G+C Gram-positive bacteria)]|uniref:hypothetical protein n=1 Tax=Gordonia sp. (in: high G+C Gram-positive bacteria) TaxID=84139 RepID=UPI003C739E0A